MLYKSSLTFQLIHTGTRKERKQASAMESFKAWKSADLRDRVFMKMLVRYNLSLKNWYIPSMKDVV
jgi:hypothetical protein